MIQAGVDFPLVHGSGAGSEWRAAATRRSGAPGLGGAAPGYAGHSEPTEGSLIAEDRYALPCRGLQPRIMLDIISRNSVLFGAPAFLGIGAMDQVTGLVVQERLPSTAGARSTALRM